MRDDNYAALAILALANGERNDRALDGARLIVLMARAMGVKPRI